MNRAYLVALLLSAVGILGAGVSLRHMGRALSYRLRPGKPYIAGSLRRSTFSLAVMLAVALCGLSLGAVRWLARDYQHVPGTIRAGRLQVAGAPSLLLQFQADSRHPGAPVLASGLDGNAWQVRGLVIAFPAWTRHVGLGAFHRITAAGAPGAAPAPLPASARGLRELAAALPPALGVTQEDRLVLGQGELPVWTMLLVSRDGYRLGGADGGDALDPEAGG